MARVTIDNDYMRKLQSLMDNDNAAKITEDALTLLNWAAEETRKGRQIFSADPDATDIHKLAMPSLSKLKA